jgi:tetratricopeptide (TPR) repeat protein
MTEKNDAMERFETGNSHLNEGCYEEAMEEFMAAIRAEDEFAEAHNNLGLSLFYQGRVEEAIAEFRRALGIEPEFALAHANLGLALLNSQLTDGAIEELGLAVRIDEGLAEAHYNLGIAYSRKGLINEAITAYEAFLENAPEHYSNYVEGVRKIVEQLKLKVSGDS